MKDELAKICTENLCIAGQFFATHNLSQRFHPSQCQFMHLLNENLGSSTKAKVIPVGNRHHSHDSIKKAQCACYLAMQDQIKEEDLQVFPPTGQQNRYALAMDKGTAPKDLQRQAIVLSKISYETGRIIEILVSASVIPKADAEGVLCHVTSEAQKLFTTKNISFICTDNKAVYRGSISGTIERMKK